MNRLLFLILLVYAAMVSCSKAGGTNSVPATDKIDTANASVKYSGNFMAAPGESVRGTALVLLNGSSYSLALKSFVVTNGPDLHLYLCKEVKPVNFIDLGKLKSTSGDALYPLSTRPDFTQYKYVLIFCQQYNVLFGSAELK